MRQVLIDKVTVNIGVGEASEKLNKAAAVLESLTGQKPVRTSSKKRIPTWGVRPGLELGVKVTVRGEKSVELLKRLLNAVDNKVKKFSFNSNGNFAFGIRSYIDVPGMKYDPSAGIFGMDVCVTFKRKGYRVRNRKKSPSKVGGSHYMNFDDAAAFLKKDFEVVIK